MTHHIFKKISLQELSLIFITILWGATFLIVQRTLSYVDAMFLVGLRFGMATIFSLALSGKTILKFNRYDFLVSGLIGVAIFLGYGLQTLGLHYVTSSQSAFITTLYVPFVPFLQWFLTKKAPGLFMWLSVGCAFIGLVILTGYQNFLTLHFGKGEIITCLCALSIACEISLLSRFAPFIKNSKNAATIQTATAGFLGFMAMPFFGEKWPIFFSWKWFVPILALALLSSFVQIVVNWAQKTVSSTRASVIYAGEPIWAGLVGWMVGEDLSTHVILGAFLIVVAVLVSELSVTQKET